MQKIIIMAHTFKKEANFIRVTGSGSVDVDFSSISVSNVGGADGSFLGTTLKDGETLNFDAGATNNFFEAETVTYDATGTEFIIIYIV
jgi:hypothetical protein